MTISIALIIFSGAAVATCLFSITYFLFIKQVNRYADTSLGLLFLAIALRISKSIFYYIFPDISAFGVAMGLFGFASIGPFALLYFKFSKARSFQLKFTELAHFSLAIIGFLIIFIFDEFRNLLYKTAALQLGMYLFYIGYKYILAKNGLNLSRWHYTLFYGLVALLGVFVLQFYMGTIESYTVGTALASTIVYILFFMGLKTSTVVKKQTKDNLPHDLLKKIKSVIENDKIYRQPAITLAQFSEEIDTPTYLVSKATKAIYKKSFPEVINGFRIKEITQKLSDPNSNSDKIEGLAYDVGFKTSSAFYNAFKKETSMSPREYQKQLCLSAID